MKSKKPKNGETTAVTVAVMLNFILFAVKLYCGIAASSLCIYTDSINNLADTLTCSLAIIGFVWMGKNSTPDYPDGYGKAEELTGFIMSLSVAGAGLYFVYTALERLMYPRPVNFQLRFALLLTLTIPVKLGLGIFFRRYAKRHASVIVKTVYMDSFSDAGVTAMTLLSFILSEYAGVRADALFGLAVGILITVNGIRLLKDVTGALLGKNDVSLNKIIETILTDEHFEVITVKTYRTGQHITAVAETVGGETEENAVIRVKNTTGADLYIQRRI